MFETLPDFLSVKECQEALHLGRNSVLNFIYSGELSAFKLKGAWKIPKSELIRFIKRYY